MCELRVIKQWRPDLERFEYRIEELSRGGPNVHPFVEHSDGLLSVSSPEDLCRRVGEIQAALCKPVMYWEVKMRWVEETPILKSRK